MLGGRAAPIGPYRRTFSIPLSLIARTRLRRPGAVKGARSAAERTLDGEGLRETIAGEGKDGVWAFEFSLPRDSRRLPTPLGGGQPERRGE